MIIKTDAERFGVDKAKLNPCLCGSIPKVGSVTHGMGDFGAKVYCKCGHTVEQDYSAEMSMEDKWNKYNPERTESRTSQLSSMAYNMFDAHR